MPGMAPFRHAFERHLRRRRLALGLSGSRRWGWRTLLMAGALLLLVALGVLPRPGGPVASVLLFAALLIAGTVLGAVRSVLREGGRDATARTLDRALGNADLVATAVALSARPSPAGRFPAAVLERAGEEVAALPEERVGPLPRPPWGLILLAAAVAFLIPLLPEGGFGLLPGLGGGWGKGGWRHRDGDSVAAQLAAPATEKSEADARPGSEAPSREEPKVGAGGASSAAPGAPPARQEPLARLSLVPLSRTYPPDAPVTVGAAADGLPGAGQDMDLDLAISVDDGPAVPEKRPFRLAAGGRETRGLDLRTLPGLSARLSPGKHRVKGLLRDAAGGTAAESPEVVIEVEAGDGQGGGGGGKPPPSPPPPSSAPASPPPAAREPPPPKKGPGGAGQPPGAEPVPPPSRFDRKFVNPLFGEGDEAVKKGPLLVLDPEGSRGEEPREMPPEEALREVRARAEAAARREGVDPRDLEAIRRYFEALRRIVEGGK